MFEKKNVGVNMKLQVWEVVERTIGGDGTPDAAVAAYLVEATHRVIENMDGKTTRSSSEPTWKSHC